MKKFLVLLLCLLAVFAIVSCKEEPSGNQPDSEPAPEGPPTDPGTLIVRPGEDSTFSQSGKFQFQLSVSYNELESIEFLAKFSDDVTKITVRQAGDGDPRFLDDALLSDLEQDEDGWYIIQIPAEDVVTTSTPRDSLGITVRLPDSDRENCFVAIKDMMINDVEIDFTEWAEAEDEYVRPYVTSPDSLDVEIL